MTLSLWYPTVLALEEKILQKMQYLLENRGSNILFQILP